MLKTIEENLTETKRIVESSEENESSSPLASIEQKLTGITSGSEDEEDFDLDVRENIDEAKSDIDVKTSEESEEVSDGRIDDLESRVEQLRNDFEEETVHEDALINRIDSLENDLKDLKNSSVRNDRIKKLEKEIEELSKKQDSVDEGLKGDVDLDSSTISNVESDVEDLREALNMLVDNEEENAEELQEIKDKIGEHQEAISYLMHNLTELSEVVKNQLDNGENRSLVDNQFEAR